jgi:hypothetical protein
MLLQRKQFKRFGGSTCEGFFAQRRASFEDRLIAGGSGWSQFRHGRPHRFIEVTLTRLAMGTRSGPPRALSHLKNFPRLKPRLNGNFSLGPLEAGPEIDCLADVRWRARRDSNSRPSDSKFAVLRRSTLGAGDGNVSSVSRRSTGRRGKGASFIALLAHLSPHLSP